MSPQELFSLIKRDEGLQEAGQGLKEGLAGVLRSLTVDTAGAPVDLLAMLFNSLGLKTGDKPFGGSAYLREKLGQPKEETTTAGKIGQVLGSSVNPETVAKLLPLALGVFVGPKSKVWNSQAAEMLKAIEEYPGMALRDKEAYKDALFADTKVFRSPGDKQPRLEISDKGSTLNLPKKEGTFKLSEVLNHPSLFEAYPEFKNLSISTVKTDPSRLGSFNPYEGITINLNSPKEQQSTLLHEIQHAIQAKEGFARGGTPELFDPRSIEAVQVANTLRAKKVTPTDELVQNILYRRLSGEAEARAVQARFMDALKPLEAPTKGTGWDSLEADVSKGLEKLSPENAGAGYDILFKNLINKYYEP